MKFSDQFIKATREMCDFDHYVPAPYLRKAFCLNFRPEKAEITICGLGFYELYLNGRNITKGPLAPYISNPDDICYYDSYDISALLREGENVVGILLGNGFRNSFGGFVWDFDRAPCRGTPAVALCLEASAKDRRFEMEADTSFKVHASPICFDDERMGCRYDARREIPGWNLPGFDDSGWENALTETRPKGIAKLCEAEPIAEAGELSAVSITHYDVFPYCYRSADRDAPPFESAVMKDVYVYDFGVNSAGVTKLNLPDAREGQRIIVRHAEDAAGGRLSVNSTVFLGDGTTEKYLEYAQTDVYVCRGGGETFVPRFKYDGFRYAIVGGLTEEQASRDAVTFVQMHSDLEARAGFRCSDSALNRLQEMTRRSVFSNFFYFPTDCPHREKNGWTGDASASAEHILLNLKAEKSLKEWLANIRLAQREDGALPGIVPTGGWGFEWGNGPMWDSVCVSLPYFIYRFSGDESVIADNREMILKYLRYIASRRDERGLIAVGLGDWCDPFESKNGSIASPLAFTDSAVISHIARKAAFLFERIGDAGAAGYAGLLADEVRQSIRTHLIDKETKLAAGNCQTSQAVALETGLFEPGELPEAQKRLVEIVHRDGDVNACGMIGLRFLFHALVHAGEAELAYRIITSEERTCYGYWLKNGATSLWETFPDLTVTTGASKNHHFFGDISSLFIQEFAGLKPNPDADNVRYFEISPHFIRALDFAEAYYAAPSGRVSVRWERTPDGIDLTVSAPADCEGRILLPKGYRFEGEKRSDGSKAGIRLTPGSTRVFRIPEPGTPSCGQAAAAGTGI